MRHYLTLFLLLPFTLLAAGETAEKPLKVLFIGNSYTAWHNLPEIVAQMAQSQGQRLYYESVTPGGRTFERHWKEGAALEKIYSLEWDFVMLQNQSYEPVSDPAKMLAYGERFSEAVEESGATCIYFMTWAYAAPRSWMEDEPEALALFPEMQQRLNDAYRALAAKTGGLLCPVGPAWARFLETSPETRLHHTDDSHAAPAGGYLAALMMYAVLFDEDVAGMPRTVFPYFDTPSRERWGEALSIDAATGALMESVVNRTRRLPAEEL